MVSPKTASLVTLCALPVAISSFAIVVWLPYLAALGNVGKSLGQHVAEEGVGFRDGLHTGASTAVLPGDILNYSGVLGWAVLAVAVVVLIWWAQTRSRGAGSGPLVFLLIPTALPLLLGLALAPVHIRWGFSALAAAGLGSSGLIGIGVGESLSLVALGGYLSLGLFLLVLIVQLKRSDAHG